MLIEFIGLASCAGFVLWLYALRNAPAGVVTALLALSPITAAGASVFWLGGSIKLVFAVSLLLIAGSRCAMAFDGKPGDRPAEA